MTEYWKSNENWFCKYCKCWVSDNPVSRQIHENGTRHKQSVEEKLSEIRRKQIQDVKVAKDESHWLKKMEEAALRDYKKKDIASNRDFTAKLYNNEDLPDVDAKYENIRKSNEVGPRLPGEPEPKHLKFEHMLKAGEEREDKEKVIAPVKASSSGTKWHNPAPPKMWYEARSDDGTVYFWNTITKESRWDAPPGGYVSVEEQEVHITKKEQKIAKKAQLITEQRKLHLKKKEDEPEPIKTDRYGGSGWKTVETQAKNTVDLGLPAHSEGRLQPVIKATPDRQYTFKEKTIESLGEVVGAKPVITFRKRKNNAVRERTDDD
ncbi:WW domain-binding protein 4 [Eurytemora carolleeae]|uniref:WW domain-binding protein 4 n=1 Tax=Eurytemora carolleeae TaxID=1294199 RepID=UPI000C7641D8|nr:WW domain-binding protein 4 [Eurytemora carolleeae]|eukprot:XP_023346452.1 WW domain-binding protein 4-like [Eurytemora affinis]